MDKKNIGRGNQFSTILTEEMNNLMKFKNDENKHVAVKFSDSILQNDIRQVNLNLYQIQTHERNFIKSSIDNNYFTNFADNRPFRRKDIKNDTDLRMDKISTFKEALGSCSRKNSSLKNKYNRTSTNSKNRFLALLNEENIKTEDDNEFDRSFDRDSVPELLNLDLNDDFNSKDLQQINNKYRFSSEMKNIDDSYGGHLSEFKQPPKGILAKNKLSTIN